MSFRRCDWSINYKKMHEFKLGRNKHNIISHITKIKKDYYIVIKYNKKFYKKPHKVLTTNLLKSNNLIIFTKFIILIKLKKLNIFLCISNNKGLNFYSFTKFSLKLTKKSKNNEILKKLIETIFLKSVLLKNSPLVLHFINLSINFNWSIKLISKKLLIINIKNFYRFSHNGCRKKKIK